ncbi:MAG: M36 family metallopeptidase [Bryobacterales bacterium]|nr:M36 family metallopeptidase [Bryobacterales bacterium]
MLAGICKTLCFAVAISLTGSLLPGQPAPEQLIDLTAAGARVAAASRGQALSSAGASPAAAVAAFLRGQNRPQAAVDTLMLDSESTDPRTGLTHLRFHQAVNGVDVYGAYVKATVNPRNELVHIVELLPDPAPPVSGSAVTPLAALEAAAGALYPGRAFRFRPAGLDRNTTRFASSDAFFHRDPTVTRVLLPFAGGAMQEGWLVETWTAAGNQLHHTLVGGLGRVLQSELRTANESYNIFVEHPVVTLGGSIGTPQTIVAGPGPSAASPNGWVSADGRTAGAQSQYRLSGNNVYAYLDRDQNNSPDPAGAAITDGNFTAAAQLAQSPTLAVNQQVAVQNLFWAGNVIHDKLYTHGFIEAAGNFQQNNFGKGGLGNDSLNAEAQDGSGTNNANFSTPSDGSSPRMQMYLWTYTTPNRDGDVDTDIVYHEYGHGLTWRMIGSMSGCMSGAVGEGASDALSIWMNGDDVVGEYSFNKAVGIRRYAYTGYPLTYADLSGSSVHANGELFAAIMWRAREYFQANNISLDLLWDYFVDGMNYIPAGPRFEDMRNGIVQSAVNRGLGHQCHIWKAFADFGVGVGASGSCTGFLSFITWRVTESFSLPAECAGNTAPAVNIESPASGAIVSGSVPISISASDAQDAAGTLTVQWQVDGGDWQSAVYNSGTGKYEAVWDSLAGSDGNHTITARATDSGSLAATDSNAVIVDNVNEPPVASFTFTCSGLTCDFNGSGSSDPDGTISSYAWNFGDLGTGAGVTASHTYAAAGTYTATLTVTDNSNATATAEKYVTVTAPPPGTMHINALDGSGSNQKNSWTATVKVTIHNESHGVVTGATVNGSWSNGASGTASCTTTAAGTCSVTKGGIRKTTSSVKFTVTGVTHTTLTYNPSDNEAGPEATVSKP